MAIHNIESFSAESFMTPAVKKIYTPSSQSFNTSHLQINHTAHPSSPPPSDSPTRNAPTDHMAQVTWSSSSGWSAPKILPYSPLTLDPSASVLHYATSCFEGMKAWRGYDGNLRLLRPRYNCARMLASATRASLPGFDTEDLLNLIRTVLAIDGGKWAPATQPGSVLYIRPTLIGTGDNLGYKVPDEAMLFVIVTVCPTINPSTDSTAIGKKIRLLASDGNFVRAWPGGSGSAKISANYGPSLLAHHEANNAGCDQVLWLFGADGQVTEAGASNFFVIWRTAQGTLEMVTPPLGDHTILPGVTRKSVLELARAGFEDVEAVDVVERKFSIHDIITAAGENRLMSAFAVGTAFFIAQVERIRYGGLEINFSDAPYIGLLQKGMLDIVLGKKPSPWTDIIQE
ncbi:hypothetical protein AWENTII_012140 [Aspergillus wentii]